MAASILFYGQDTCDRLPDLTDAGYSVDESGSPSKLNMPFQLGYSPDAVVFSSNRDDFGQVVWITRKLVTSRTVLFQDMQRPLFPEHKFDLVIPPLTSPGRWLFDLAGLLEWGRGVELRSRMRQGQSQFVGAEDAMVRKASRLPARAICVGVLSEFEIRPFTPPRTIIVY